MSFSALSGPILEIFGSKEIIFKYMILRNLEQKYISSPLLLSIALILLLLAVTSFWDCSTVNKNMYLK